MILFYVILILLFINGNKSDEYIKPTNYGDKIRYFNKVIRVTHPITIHPHLTLLFRMKIGILKHLFVHFKIFIHNLCSR